MGVQVERVEVLVEGTTFRVQRGELGALQLHAGSVRLSGGNEVAVRPGQAVDFTLDGEVQAPRTMSPAERQDRAQEDESHHARRPGELHPAHRQREQNERECADAERIAQADTLDEGHALVPHEAHDEPADEADAGERSGDECGISHRPWSPSG